MNNIIFYKPPVAQMGPIPNPYQLPNPPHPWFHFPSPAYPVPLRPQSFTSRKSSLVLPLRSASQKPPSIPLPRKPPITHPLPSKPPMPLSPQQRPSPTRQFPQCSSSPRSQLTRVSPSPGVYEYTDIVEGCPEPSSHSIVWPSLRFDEIETVDLTNVELVDHEMYEGPLPPAGSGTPFCTGSLNGSLSIPETPLPETSSFTETLQSNPVIPESPSPVFVGIRDGDSEGRPISIDSEDEGAGGVLRNRSVAQIRVKHETCREHCTRTALSCQPNNSEMATCSSRAKTSETESNPKHVPLCAVLEEMPAHDPPLPIYDSPQATNDRSSHVDQNVGNSLILGDECRGDNDYIDSRDISDIDERITSKRQRVSSRKSPRTQHERTRLAVHVEIPESQSSVLIDREESIASERPPNASDQPIPWTEQRLLVATTIASAVIDALDALSGDSLVNILTGSPFASRGSAASEQGIDRNTLADERSEQMRDRGGGRVTLWTPDEDTRLLGMVERNQPLSEIAKRFPHRTESSLRQRMVKVRKDKKLQRASERKRKRGDR
ncbi:hypothetical protein FQN57_001934 [Myotisia sp. PD_48]|nr:hypothetical protein FQN57_001934 [Myotisia sp. PD_48]